jgi:hypothetical protein
VVIDREEADATKGSIGSEPINAKPFTPHLGVKQPSPLTALMGDTARGKVGDRHLPLVLHDKGK